MKKLIALLTIFAGISLTTPYLQADAEATQQETAGVFNRQQERTKRGAVLINLLQKAYDGECHLNVAVYYILEWIKELETSDHPEDQKLCEELCTTVRNLTAMLNEIADKAEQEEAAHATEQEASN